MTDNLILQRYRDLAVMIIVNAINDYLSDKEYSAKLLKSWMDNCTYIDYLGIDREWMFMRVVALKRAGYKKLEGFHTYGENF